jgi:hypothetical protein
MYAAKQAGRGRVFIARKPDADTANTGTSAAIINGPSAA